MTTYTHWLPKQPPATALRKLETAALNQLGQLHLPVFPAAVATSFSKLAWEYLLGMCLAEPWSLPSPKLGEAKPLPSHLFESTNQWLANFIQFLRHRFLHSCYATIPRFQFTSGVFLGVDWGQAASSIDNSQRMSKKSFGKCSIDDLLIALEQNLCGLILVK